MYRKLVLALLVSLPLISSAAADGAKDKPAKGNKPAAQASAPAASPSANPAQAANNHNSRKSEIQHQQSRGSKMGECQKLAADRGLKDIERKQFLGSCVAGK
jgi:hypothetical protein